MIYNRTSERSLLNRHRLRAKPEDLCIGSHHRPLLTIPAEGSDKPHLGLTPQPGS